MRKKIFILSLFAFLLFSCSSKDTWNEISGCKVINKNFTPQRKEKYIQPIYTGTVFTTITHTRHIPSKHIVTFETTIENKITTFTMDSQDLFEKYDIGDEVTFNIKYYVREKKNDIVIVKVRYLEN